VLWPQGIAHLPDAAAVAIALTALAALASGRVGIIPVIAASGLAGFLLGRL
jgi:chromate transporter